jgi:pteridine reductase
VRPRALVTGAAVRVGRAIAVELARSGFDLALHYRSRASEIEETAQECRALGAEVGCVAADLATPEGCAGVVGAVRARWDALHLFVNNASVFYPVPFEQISLDEWERMLGVNTRAGFLLSRDLLPLLRAADGAAIGAPSGQHAVVVHMVDIGAERPVKGHAHYSVSKAGLAMLVKAMAVELAPAVRTVGISPGQVVWPDDYTPDLRARLAARIPMGRVGTPEDVARLVRFVVLEGHYLNGILIPVDGGLGARY